MDEAGPWEQLWQHSRQVGRAPLEFGSFPEAVEGGEDHAGKQLLNHLPGTSQATSVLSLGSFLHDLCRMPSAMPPPPDTPPPHPRRLSKPSLTAEKAPPLPSLREQLRILTRSIIPFSIRGTPDL